ncbi:hypothetical protein EST38_g6300 [Candolleomyces aberdarensis]|uniref:Uncharacterized protein n=1 Tax=Candolleomyces aberdarensis TaxID=2316362 RepID=A0A4Q2DK38_9AGAR|nr:hypothetical protein EST38_g6300 [Candolleomyces aberdarensis]
MRPSAGFTATLLLALKLSSVLAVPIDVSSSDVVLTARELSSTPLETRHFEEYNNARNFLDEDLDTREHRINHPRRGSTSSRFRTGSRPGITTVKEGPANANRPRPGSTANGFRSRFSGGQQSILGDRPAIATQKEYKRAVLPEGEDFNGREIGEELEARGPDNGYSAVRSRGGSGHRGMSALKRKCSEEYPTCLFKPSRAAEA